MTIFVPFSVIESALPFYLEWTEEKLRKIANQTNSPLRPIQSAGSGTPRLWGVENVIAWFAHRHRRAGPELGEMFARDLRAAAKAYAAATAKRKRKTAP